MQGKPVQVGQVSVGGRGNKSVARIVAENTGLSINTVKRATGQIAAPTPKPKVVDIKSALEPESDYDAIIREANAGAVDSYIAQSRQIRHTADFRLHSSCH